MRISDLSSDVCSSDLQVASSDRDALLADLSRARAARVNLPSRYTRPSELAEVRVPVPDRPGVLADVTMLATELDVNIVDLEIAHSSEGQQGVRSEEHTSELQSPMRISYAVFCLQKKTQK